ncbi:class I SAM-dependent methyltransferase [Sphingopyxis sp. GW247-27LB]|uniref:class I SAM-dependent methyltransferase n=1 Tax=Sphingopyxis sp. GW247-27LB TaxID=2012632 RepID=UPI00092A9A0D|nr:class I SAM-dependent methyltransferase [Sphingopyxis sp. GW247-27LB]OJX78196.1 MAG: hypothetical protein BGO92_02100 [Magnetospirillum sp. 64-120]PAL25319.1 hypothetical protein CD928_02170 [Sphingopyxis sp. GW247-27LB]
MGSQTVDGAIAIEVRWSNLLAAKVWIVTTRALLRLLWSADRMVRHMIPLRGIRTKLDCYRRADHDLRHLADLLRISISELPPTGNCAGAPDFLLLLARAVLTERPEVIVEFGSGVSTFVLAKCLEMNGTGRLISFDHSPAFAELTRRQLERQRLSADIRVVPLRPSESADHPGFWYDANDLPHAIDLIIVDGPPASLHPETRGSAGPATFAKLRNGGMVLLDDAHRSGERKILSRWRRAYPDIEFSNVDTMKGTVVGRRIGDGFSSEIRSARQRSAPGETIETAAKGALVL